MVENGPTTGKRVLTGQRCIAAAIFALSAFCSRDVGAQSAPDTLRGTVTTDSGAAIPRALVIATRAPDRAYLTDTTDAQGNYQIVFAEGTGDYLVHASAVGRKTARKRVTRVSSEREFTVDFVLVSAVQTLTTVTVSASRPIPTRRSGNDTETGEAGRYADGVNATISPDLVGNLATAALTNVGVTSIGGEPAALGLNPNQNNATLNGMAFSGASVAADADVRIKTTTSTYDPSRGGFSGAQVDAEIAPGFIFSSKHLRMLLDLPALQYTDPISSALDQRFTNVQLGGGGQGQTLVDKFTYNFGITATHRVADPASLLDAQPDLLRAAGLSVDSARRVASLAASEGLPLSGGNNPRSVNDNISFIGRFDHRPYDPQTLRQSRQTWGLITFLNATRSSGLFLGPTTVPGHSGESRRLSAGIQGTFSSYIHKNYLTEARSAFSVDRAEISPYLRIPEARISVASNFADTTRGLSSLLLGGNSSLDSDRRNWTWESSSETQFYPASHTAHRIRLNADSRVDGFSERAAANTFGSFSYQSLADFAAGRPSSFTRTLSSPRRSASEWNGFLSLGDNWKKSSTFQMLFGARLEGNRYLKRPDYNLDVDRLFGVRTDHVPNSVHISPRLGFTWATKPGGEGFRFSPIGRFDLREPAYWSGGIGEFRSMLDPRLLSDAIAVTGLVNGVTGVACVGFAVPIPDWAGYAAGTTALPAACATGSSPFAQTVPGVDLIDKSYQPPRSWRANLARTSKLWKVTYTLDGTYSLGLNQPSRTDLNFVGIQRMTLGGEGRPVFVSTADIVPNTGALLAGNARISPLFAQVMDAKANSRSISRQWKLTATPDVPLHFYVSFAYALSSTRSLRNGYDAPTFGSPLQREWARGDFDLRHQFGIQAGTYFKSINITLFTRFQSGFPFTPLIGGDANGDGFANDRAFVFDTSGAPDPTLAAAMKGLLRSSTPRIQKCLGSLLGKPAGVNSCEGPWTAAMNLQIGATRKIGEFNRYAYFVLAVSNPLGGLDQLIHGSANLRGWGAFASPDPVLYNIRSFDPATNRFRYEVNPRFGNIRPSETTIRAPFRVTLSARVPIGAPTAVQMVSIWLKPGRDGRPGKKLGAEDLTKRYERNINDPYTAILAERDSLLLSREQVLAIEAADTTYRNKLDSIMVPLGQYFANLADKFDELAATRRQEAAFDGAQLMTCEDIHAVAPKILTPIQLFILSQIIEYPRNCHERSGGRTIRLGS